MLNAPGGPRERVYRTRQSVAAVEALLLEAGTRPTVLFLVSNGYGTDVPAVSAHLTEIAALAGRALVPVVVLDPRFVAADAKPPPGVAAIAAQHQQQVTTTTLQRLARDTGGTIWEEGDALSSVLRRLPKKTP